MGMEVEDSAEGDGVVEFRKGAEGGMRAGTEQPGWGNEAGSF